VRWDSSSWTAQLDAAFQALKAAMLKHASSSEFDPRLATTVYTDASGTGLAYLITQLGDDGHERTIVMGGRKLLSFERNYEVHERELLAMRECTRRFEHYLRNPFTWRTDNQTCARILTSPPNYRSRAIAKFATELQEWPMRVELISAEQNCVADAVSRIYDDDHEPAPDTLPAVCVLDCDHHDDDEYEEEVLAEGRVTPATPQLLRASDDDDDVDDKANSARRRIADESSAPPSTATTIAAAPAAPPATSTTIDTPVSTSTTSVLSSDSPSGEPPIRPSFLPMRTALRGWRESQLADKSLTPLWAAAQGDAHVPHAVRRLQPCIGEYGILYVRDPHDASQTRIVVPIDRVAEMLVAAHNGLDGGHAGVRGTKYIASQSCWWPTQEADIKKHCSECLFCHSLHRAPLNADMGTPTTKVARFQVVHVDAIPMSKDDEDDGITDTSTKPKGIWVMTDRATGFTKLVPYTARDSDGAIAAIDSWIGLFDKPQVLQFDCATELRSRAMEEFAKKNNITLRSGSAQNQQSNGVAEAVVGKVKKLLNLMCRDNLDAWPRKLSHVERSINRAYSRSRHASPFELMFGSMPHLAVQGRLGVEHYDSALPTTKEEVAEYKKALGEKIASKVAAAGEARAAVQASNVAYFKKIGESRDISVGDYVMLANDAETEKTSIENKQRQSGPYVVESISDVDKRVEIRRVADNVKLDRPVSMNRLQHVSKAAVETALQAGDEPGAVVFTGPTDPSLLLSGERRKVEREVQKAARAQAAAKKKEDDEREANERKKELAEQRHQARAAAFEEAEQRRKADAARVAQAKAAQRAAELAIVIPRNAVPTKAVKWTDGEKLFVPLEGYPNGGAWIGKQHPRFNELERRWLQAKGAAERDQRHQARKLRSA
jgi:hypothetical protein